MRHAHRSASKPTHRNVGGRRGRHVRIVVARAAAAALCPVICDVTVCDDGQELAGAKSRGRSGEIIRTPQVNLESSCLAPLLRGPPKMSTRLYIGNLPSDIRRDEVERLFDSFGTCFLAYWSACTGRSGRRWRIRLWTRPGCARFAAWTMAHD